MFSYYFDTTEYSEILQYVSLFLLFVIGTMIYYMSNNTDTLGQDLKNKLNSLDLNCPECPENPACPACPKCPDLKCDDGICPKCPECPTSTKTECPKTSCPSVNDIVSGIFPGRNTGVTNSGEYFDIMADNSYELLPDYDFYNPVDAFPSDSILSASKDLVKNNIDVPPNKINNSYDNNLINTSPDISLTRMNMASTGENTGPTTFGMGTEKVDPKLSNIEKQRLAAASDDGDPNKVEKDQKKRDNLEENLRDDLKSQSDNN